MDRPLLRFRAFRTSTKRSKAAVREKTKYKLLFSPLVSSRGDFLCPKTTNLFSAFSPFSHKHENGESRGFEQFLLCDFPKSILYSIYNEDGQETVLFYPNIFFKYNRIAFSPASLSVEILVSEMSNSIHPQCPLNVGKQIIRRYLLISGLKSTSSRVSP